MINKYKPLYIFLILMMLWSLFFAMYKYFFWGIFGDTNITLQSISGYMSIGTFSAFIIGGLLYEILKERKLHFMISLLITLVTLRLYLTTLTSIPIGLAIGIFSVFVGFFYGLWGVLKNILIPILIEQTKLEDTQINGLANIFFISFIIIGTIGGSFVRDRLNTTGVWILLSIMMITTIIGLLLTPETQISRGYLDIAKSYRDSLVVDFKYLFKKYGYIMFFTAIIITIGTILSQIAIEFFSSMSDISNAKASSLLLYSAIGSIFGNILSMKITKNRWIYFSIFIALFGVGSILFPIIMTKGFLYTAILATTAGIFFGLGYNLIEGYFFKKIGQDDKKSNGAVSLGIITNLVIFIMMFGIDNIKIYLGISYAYISMGAILLFIALFIYINRRALD